MKDASGKTPAKLTRYEAKWRESIISGDLHKRMVALTERQALPLREKIAMSTERIREWYEAFDGRVSISYSGGKDSEVLKWLVRRAYPGVEAVFCNTGLEYPEVVKRVRETDNVRVLRPKIPFHKVIAQYGWPMVSKKVARGVNILKHPTGKNKNIVRLYNNGINRFGEPVSGFKVPDRWRFLVSAPFEVSDVCCKIMKKDPMAAYEAETGNAQFVGTMASDSKQRQKIYLQTGCNAFDMKRPRSAPISFWTEQDVLQCLTVHGLPYASVYGKIQQDKKSGRLYFDGVSSTGCMFCGFGLHMEGLPNRFQRMHNSHPKLHEFCVHKLGLGSVLDYIRANCPDKGLRRHFFYSPVTTPKQENLFCEEA